MINNIDNPPFKSYNGDEPYAFVSYAHNDKEIVYPILSTLNQKGFHIWYDEGILVPDNWENEIMEYLVPAKCVIIFISNNAMESKYVKFEIHQALDANKKIIPIYIEETEVDNELKLKNFHDIQGISRYNLRERKFLKKLSNELDKILNEN